MFRNVYRQVSKVLVVLTFFTRNDTKMHHKSNQTTIVFLTPYVGGCPTDSRGCAVHIQTPGITSKSCGHLGLPMEFTFVWEAGCAEHKDAMPSPQKFQTIRPLTARWDCRSRTWGCQINSPRMAPSDRQFLSLVRRPWLLSIVLECCPIFYCWLRCYDVLPHVPYQVVIFHASSWIWCSSSFFLWAVLSFLSESDGDGSFSASFAVETPS